MKAPGFWYRPRGRTAKLLAPLGRLYRVMGVLRRKVTVPYRAGIPVICVGNIVAGGSGKTPVALAIAALLKQKGHKPVFVTRGYGGTQRGPLRVKPEFHTAHDVGDEALLLARRAPVWVGRDRAAAIQEAEREATHIILDDGLQNPNVRPDLSFLTIDGEAGLGNECFIPAGPLRESLVDALKRVTAVIIVGEDRHGLAARMSLPVLHARYEPDLPADFPRGAKFFAFAGIGRPEKFYETCRKAGLALAGTANFADHHVFTMRELDRLQQKAVNLGAQLLTTEKDFVRLPLSFRGRVLALPVRLQFGSPDALGKILDL